MNYSEYRKKYRPIGASAIKTHYSQLLAYRRSRRYNECSHHSWAWPDVESDPSSSENEDETEIRDKSPVIPEKSNGVKEGPLVKGMNGESKGKDEADESDIEERLKRLAFEKAQQQSEAVHQRSRKPRNPKNRAPIPKRSKSPVQRPESCPPENIKAEKQLFLPFGIGNRHGAETFNVRSDRDVRPSALRAKRRRQIEIERRAAEKLVVPARQKRKQNSSGDPHFEARMRRDTTQWESEYANRYPSYESAHYRRSLANMTPRPPSASAF